MTLRIKMVGIGGQGIVMAGLILGEAASMKGYNVLQSQEYSSQSRGGASNTNVIISEEPIYDFSITEADVLVAMAQDPYEANKHTLVEDGTLIIDTDLVRTDRRHVGAPFTRLAHELGNPYTVNMLMLGYLVGHTQIVDEETLKKALLRRIPKGTEEVNLKALEKGLELAKKHRGI